MEQVDGYGQFCPVAMASEVICARWTPLILRELLCGSTRFNDLRRGVPRMSPTLLSKRLKELEQAGVIETKATGQAGIVEYHLTQAGQELRPIVMSLGIWGQRWVETQLSLKNLDPSLLMWDMRRSLDLTPMPPRRCTIQFHYPELPAARQHFWLVIDNRLVDLCPVDPGYEVDLFVETSLRTMTAIWMGLTNVQAELDAGRHGAVRRQDAGALHAAMAGPQPVREGEEPPRGLGDCGAVLSFYIGGCCRGAACNDHEHGLFPKRPLPELRESLMPTANKHTTAQRRAAARARPAREGRCDQASEGRPQGSVRPPREVRERPPVEGPQGGDRQADLHGA